MKRYQIKGRDCNLCVYANEVKGKMAILFLHGGPGSGAQAIMELSAFKTLENNYFCVYFDQRGSGESNYDLEQGLSIEQITMDVMLVTEDIKRRWSVDKVILWGGSFGGCLACLCMERYPDIFNGLILSSPAITFTRQQAIDFYKRMQGPYLERFNQKEQLAINSDLAPEVFFSTSAVRKIIFSKNNPSQSLRHIAAMSSWFYCHQFVDLFNKIKIPTLIMQGREDNICIYENINEEVKQIVNHNIHYYLFAACGHAVFIDQEKEFIIHINQFIKENELC